MENTLEKKTTTAKSQFEQMLMLDHKYRELKEQLNKDKQAVNIQEESKSPELRQISRSPLKVVEDSKQLEIQKASDKLQKAKEIELKRRKILKQTYERKIKELKGKIKNLEDENEK